MTDKRSLGRTCSCGVAITNHNKSGMCKPCCIRARLADPVLRQLRAEGIRRKFADPDYHAKMSRIMVRNRQKAELDPAIAEKLRVVRLANLAKGKTPEVEARRIAALKACIGNKHKWLPDSYRPLYTSLRKKHGAPTAKEMVLKQIADRQALRHIDDCIYHLRRFSPVTRIDDRLFRFGNATVSPGELVERARARGWKEAA